MLISMTMMMSPARKPQPALRHLPLELVRPYLSNIIQQQLPNAQIPLRGKLFEVACYVGVSCCGNM